jgi:hypothetical protein
VLIRELLGGVSVLVVAGFLVIGMFPPSQPAGGALVLAVACGLVRREGSRPAGSGRRRGACRNDHAESLSVQGEA